MGDTTFKRCGYGPICGHNSSWWLVLLTMHSHTVLSPCTILHVPLVDKGGSLHALTIGFPIGGIRQRSEVVVAMCHSDPANLSR